MPIKRAKRKRERDGEKFKLVDNWAAATLAPTRISSRNKRVFPARLCANKSNDIQTIRMI